MNLTPHSSTSVDRRLLGILLTPSWLSGVASVLISLAITVGTIVLSRYRGSNVQLEFLHYQSGQAPSINQALRSGLLSNTFIANLPLLLFWSLVGLVVYLFAANIFKAFASTAKLKDELDYVHVDRHELLWQAAEHLLVRLLVLIAWAGYIVFFFQRLFPYCVAAALAASSELNNSLRGSSYMLIGIALMIVALHLHVVLLRLLVLRPRLFSSALYVD